jgi:uncharacterized membrane protein YbaN (DUF454 family)
VTLIKKYLLIFSGTVSLILGIVGVFLPVLPTTPFLLLASFCYLRSSDRMYNWLINHKIFGSYIYCYLEFKAVPLKTKVGAIIFLWLTLTISMFIISSMFMSILLSIVGVAVTAHLLILKTMSPEDIKARNEFYCKKS